MNKKYKQKLSVKFEFLAYFYPRIDFMIKENKSLFLGLENIRHFSISHGATMLHLQVSCLLPRYLRVPQLIDLAPLARLFSNSL